MRRRYVISLGYRVTFTPFLQAKETGAYVQNLLDLKDKYDKLLTAAFNNDKTFQHALNQVCDARREYRGLISQ